MEKISDREKFLEKIKAYKKIAVVGLAKNVGKTTFVNFLIKSFLRSCVITIGHDGEERDVLYGIPKPPVLLPEGNFAIVPVSFIPKGSEIVETFDTPSGMVALIKAITNLEIQTVRIGGFDLTGRMAGYLLEFCDRVIIDGAFGRTGIASYVDATIVVTGAVIDDPISKTVKSIKKLLSPEISGDIKSNLSGHEEEIVISTKNGIEFLNSDEDISRILEMSGDAEWVYIPRVLDRSILSKIRCKLIVPSANFVLSDDFDFEVVKGINVIAVGVNSVSIRNDLNPQWFLSELKMALNGIITFDVLYDP